MKLDGIITHPSAIESVSDILDIVSRPNEYLSEILDTDPSNPHHARPLAMNHQGTPRPFPHGLWFRGESNASRPPIPSVFRDETSSGLRQYFDEREMFSDVRLKAPDSDLRGLNNLELMCLMQHHSLPTRLLDWSESPLVAAFFATHKQYYASPSYPEVEALNARGNSQKIAPMCVKNDAALYVLNAYRLNAATNLSENKDSNIFQPHDIDVVLRSIMAEHTYINSVIAKIRNLDYVVLDRIGVDIRDKLIKLEGKITDLGRKDKLIKHLAKNPKIAGDEDFRGMYHRLSAPVAVIPRRNEPRMNSQSSCFTMHGGKIIYSEIFGTKDFEKTKWNFLPKTTHLHEINEMMLRDDSPRELDVETKLYTQKQRLPFLKMFPISKYATHRIMIELDRLGMSEAMIYQDVENQSNFARRRWATTHTDKPIWSLPKRNSPLTSKLNANLNLRDIIDLSNYMKEIYGKD